MKKKDFLNKLEAIYKNYYNKQRELFFNSQNMTRFLLDFDKITYSYFEDINQLSMSMDKKIILEILKDNDLNNTVLVLNYIRDIYLLLKEDEYSLILLKILIIFFIDGSEEEYILVNKIFSENIILKYRLEIEEYVLSYIDKNNLDYYSYYRLFEISEKIKSKNIKNKLYSVGRFSKIISIKDAFTELFLEN